MQETQATITRWCEETFGEVKSNFNLATRANQEMAELLKHYGEDDNHSKLGEEMADIIIVFCRLATILRLNITFDSQDYANRDDGFIDSNGDMGHLLAALFANDNNRHATVHLDDCIAHLYSFANHKSIDLNDEIDRKMQTNRQRKWKLDGKGCGQHIEE